MASKRRLRRKSCERKIRYPDEESAKAAAAAQRRRFGGWIMHYGPCKFCGGWHTGHPPKRIRQAIRARRRAGDT